MAMIRAVAALSLLAVAGCSLVPGREPGPPGPIRLQVKAGTRLNPDELGNSLPTAVRVYQLKGVGKTSSAELGALLREPKEVLGEDLLGVEEVFVEPNGAVEKTISREKETRALMVVAVVRRPSGDGWRIVKELTSRDPVEVAVTVDEYRLVAK
jgi:type VI secretion system VasD/TssJ family lipoprotein